MNSRRVLIVEDDPLLQSLIADLLTSENCEVQVASSAAEGKNTALTFDPDVALVDIELGSGPNGIDLAEYIREQLPHVAIVLLTHLPDPRFLGENSRSIPKGVSYVRKDSIAKRGALLAVVETAAGEHAKHVMRDDLDPDRPLAGLSRSQIGVLRAIAMGYSNSEIAERRGTSIRAVEHLIGRTFQAVGIDSASSTNSRTTAALAYVTSAGIPLSHE